MPRTTIFVLVVLIALISLPIAEGGKPGREVIHQSGPTLIPAGFGCAVRRAS